MSSSSRQSGGARARVHHAPFLRRKLRVGSIHSKISFGSGEKVSIAVKFAGMGPKILDPRLAPIEPVTTA